MANNSKSLDINQKQYIIDNYKSKSIRSMSRELGITPYQVKKYMINNKLSIDEKIITKRRCDYTMEQEDFIIQNYKIMPYKKIANILGKTEYAIACKISKMNLELKSKKWTTEELSVLKDVYSNYNSSYISKTYLTNRSVGEINKKAIQLNLCKESRNRFTKSDLKRMLVEFSEQINRTPTATDLMNNENIPSILTYAKYFGGYIEACTECGLKPNMCLFGEYSNMLLAKDDKTWCLSNSELIITNFLIDNNIVFEKEKYYNEICDDVRFGEKRCDWYLPYYNVVVEYFGLSNKDYYKSKMENKIDLCNDNEIPLIPIQDRRLTTSFLKEIFSEYI